MKYLTLFLCLLTVSGCNQINTDDYLYIRKMCIERNGTYFTVIVPSFTGKTLAAGCMETK